MNKRVTIGSGGKAHLEDSERSGLGALLEKNKEESGESLTWIAYQEI